MRSMSSAPLSQCIDRATRKSLFRLKIWRPKLLNTRKETIPSPSSIQTGLLNTRSAVNKAALIHDTIYSHKIDILSITETWIPSDAPDAVKLDIAPPGYTVHHSHRGSSNEKKGGGIALIVNNCFKSFQLQPAHYSEFEALSVKISSRSYSYIIATIYRPPDSDAFHPSVSLIHRI